jgi:hypothetical protein
MMAAITVGRSEVPEAEAKQRPAKRPAVMVWRRVGAARASTRIPVRIQAKEATWWGA